MADIKTIFGAIDHLDTYQRVNSTHLLDFANVKKNLDKSAKKLFVPWSGCEVPPL